MVATPQPLHVTTRGGTTTFPPGTAVVIGRDPAAAVVVSHEKASRHHLTVQFAPEHGWMLTDSSSNGTFHNGNRVGQLMVAGGVTVLLGNPVEGERVDLAVGTPTAPGAVVPAPGMPGGRPPIVPAGTSPLSLSFGELSMVYEPTKRLRIGRAPDNDVVVNNLIASRYHAQLTADGRGGWVLEDLNSFNGTFVNGQRISRRAPVANGALITIAHHHFALVDGRLEEYVDDGRVSLTALNLKVLAGKQQLLDDISFQLERNSLLAILGPTGAGKSTVMRVLTGTQAPAAGAVLYNGRNLYSAYDELRYRIGYVPQDDILHSQLPVRKALGYAAKLRFPPDVSSAERNARVDEVMAELGLTARANLAVSRLSGGQRKRTSVALELLTRPSLLSLDEPTSGLDPGYERQVMTLLRDLSRGGRTVITVTHNTESLDLCDRLLFLAPGGQVAYFGPPGEAKDFFGTEHYPEVFTRLEEAPYGSAKAAYAASPRARQYLDEPLRRQLEAAPPVVASTKAPTRAPVPSPLRQVATLTRRYTNIISSDLRNTLLLLVQAPILGLLMMVALGKDGLERGSPTATGGGTVLLALVLGASYLGAGNAVREIVKERAILARERAAGLSPGAYLWSKVLVLGVLTVVQAIILVLMGTARQGGPGAGAVISSGKLELIVVAGLTGLAAMALGLLISALVSNPDKALTILPVVLLAQFLLSGAFFDVSGSVLKPISYVTSARWGFAAAASTADLPGLVPHTCGKPVDPTLPAGTRVIKSDANDPACDSTRTHDAKTWLFDNAAIILLTVIPLIVAWLLIRRVGQPRR
jgi:ABC-type multidrug transport system ATPase subunit